MRNDFNTFAIVEEVAKKLDTNYYPTVDLPVNDVVAHVKSDPLQVRLVKLADKARVKNIVERYDPQFDEPVIAVVDDETKAMKWLVDGHHRMMAHQQMESKFIKTILIPFIDLYNSRAAAIKLGHAMNVNVVDKEECSNEDIKALIKADAAEGEDVNTPDYIRELSALYMKPPTSIGRLVRAVVHSEGLIERPLSADEAADYAEQVRANNPDAVVYHTISRVIHEQGLGAIISRMARANKPKGILLGYHSRMDHKQSHADKFDIAAAAAEAFDLNLTVLDMGFEKKDEYK